MTASRDRQGRRGGPRAGRRSGYVTVLLLFLPPGNKAVAFFGVQMGLFGLPLGGSFAFGSDIVVAR